MKRIGGILLFVLLIFPLKSCRYANESGWDDEGNLFGRISISGAWAMYPLAVKWADEFCRLHPKVQIDISAGGAGKGMADALGNMVDLAMVSREINPTEIERGAWYVAVAKDAVVPTFNAGNPLKEAILLNGLTKANFQQIFLEGGQKTWEALLGLPGSTSMTVYTRSDACGAAEIWSAYLGAAQEDLNGIGVYGDPGIADIVKNDPSGVGFNNIAFAYNISNHQLFPGLMIVPIDINENGVIDPEEDFYGTLDELMSAIAQGRYPSPPARELFFVSNGPPVNIAAIEFLKWILGKGQDFITEAGYVGLPEEKIELQKEKLPNLPIIKE